MVGVTVHGVGIVGPHREPPGYERAESRVFGLPSLQQRVAELEARLALLEARMCGDAFRGCLRAEEQQLSPAVSRFHRRLHYIVVLGLTMPLPAA